jgi:hypothetical protein
VRAIKQMLASTFKHHAVPGSNRSCYCGDDVQYLIGRGLLPLLVVIHIFETLHLESSYERITFANNNNGLPGSTSKRIMYANSNKKMVDLIRLKTREVEQRQRRQGVHTKSAFSWKFSENATFSQLIER